MSEDDNKVVTLKVRVSPEFREQLVTTAKENSRSMNAEIVHRLEESFIRESELKSRLNTVLKGQNLTNGDVIELIPVKEDNSAFEKDKKIQILEEQLANSMKMMEMITGMFESMLNGNQEEYMESVFKKYPNVKKFYKEKTNYFPKDEETENSSEPKTENKDKGSW